MKPKRPAQKGKDRVAATKNVTARKSRPRLPTFNLLISILCWLTVVVLFYNGRLVNPQKLILGQQAPETIVASVDFNAETLSATQIKQREFIEQVLPVFTVDPSGIKRAEQALSKLLPRLKALAETTDPEHCTLIRDLIVDRLDQYSIRLTPEKLLQLIPEGDVDLKRIVTDALAAPLRNGVITEADLKTRLNGLSKKGNVTVRSDQAELIRPLRSFTLLPDGLEHAVETVSDQLPRDPSDEETIRRLLRPWLQANILYDEAETALRKEQAADLADPVIEPVGRGTVLIRNGDTVSKQTLIWLSAHQERLNELETPTDRIQRLAARGLLLLIGLGLTAAIAGIIAPPLLRDRKNVLLLLLLSLLPLLLGKLTLYLTVSFQLISPSLVDYLLMPGLTVILASALAGSRAGLLVGLWSSFALAALLDNSFAVFALGLLITVTAVYSTRDVKRRAALFRAGLWVGAVKILFALIMAVLNQPSWSVLLPQLGAALASGLLGALLALLLIPLFENLFKVTTDISLLELSDLSHPLLQSLAINAPGTYHHSLMMATLAQNAAEAIGANGLQLRVCAYFHDIGKLVKPGFFSENIQYTENPHDGLAPSMSTLVIVSHIKEGITLAKKHKLPQVVIDGIQQHQGTSLISVFYHRAKTQQQKAQAADGNSKEKINDEDFRYDGPRPQNREMAILMLADSCEAASRSLEKPTLVRIRNLIGDIFDSRLRDGQLDQCTLTLKELHIIKESFIFSLTNMLHGRIAYPKDENGKDSPKNER